MKMPNKDSSMCACNHIRQRHNTTVEGQHIGKCGGFQKDATGKKYACPCVGFHEDHWPLITEQQVIDGWKRYGDGTELKADFVKWLTEDLNRKPELPRFFPHASDWRM